MERTASEILDHMQEFSEEMDVPIGESESLGFEQGVEQLMEELRRFCKSPRPLS